MEPDVSISNGWIYIFKRTRITDDQLNTLYSACANVYEHELEGEKIVTVYYDEKRNRLNYDIDEKSENFDEEMAIQDLAGIILDRFPRLEIWQHEKPFS